MEKPTRTVALLATVLLAYGCGASTTPTPPERSPLRTPLNPSQEINDRFVGEISAAIAGHENEPAGKVFQNVRGMENVPAGKLLLIMNRGYARALGVACTHCHVESDFASDAKRPKRAAREMMALHRTINDQLKEMTELDPAHTNRAINCSTCHRGQIDPMAEFR